MYAPHEPAQRPYHRVLSMACPGFLTVPQGGMPAPPAVLLPVATPPRACTLPPCPFVPIGKTLGDETAPLRRHSGFVERGFRTTHHRQPRWSNPWSETNRRR